MALSKGDIAAPFIQVKEDENGVLQDIKFVNDDNFNFAYDVVDKMAKKAPDKVAMLHISKDGKERSFTFYDMARYSSKVANYLQFLGIKKGDRVMLVLKTPLPVLVCDFGTAQDWCSSNSGNKSFTEIRF